ncbi:hypothetical protein [Streptomyces rhizosphaericus]|uniref:Uncharacterized protein n=1 Tax=Streptomyces rhizosphaericus TaxID=114699 RepID=A0A6G4A8G1_9ACTN|nr:hypothetical protein [Streptomyces rhizosphaericus]NEW69124.1 hypothetical protein [Streptomyces rhizosphaericus]
MIVALGLLAHAAALATAGGRMMRMGGWADRAPRLAITVWLALPSGATAHTRPPTTAAPTRPATESKAIRLRRSLRASTA